MAEEVVLEYLQNNQEIPNSEVFAEEKGFSHVEVVNIIKSLNGFQFVNSQYVVGEATCNGKRSITYHLEYDQNEEITKERWFLTHEGELYAKHGSPEVQIFLAVPLEGTTVEELQKIFASRLPSDVEEKLSSSIYKVGSGQAFKNKWIEKRNSGVFRKVEHVEDKVRDLLIQIQDGEDVTAEELLALQRRKLISSQTWKVYSVTKGPEYAPTRKKLATDLTRENLRSGEWKNLKFKKYNIHAKGQPTEGGCVHPLFKVRCQIQKIFREMGFEEMPTNKFVESSFWNFDALFQPQQHPARDSHDTFFLKAPSTTRRLPEDYVERVQDVHEHGGYGSKGYCYDWKRDDANKNLLRTHTTAVSARMLYALAQGPFTPKRYYSIDRVFRNEAVDRTHLAEFHQIEGLVCDRGLGVGHLTGVLKKFFSRLGMPELKFKHTYNPYTEPSMEIYCYHEGLKKWVEIGNSGMFRPEMLRPMGLPEDVQVIAWGLSLERPTMILYGIDNIRDLAGPKADLELIEKNPVCRLGY